MNIIDGYRITSVTLTAEIASGDEYRAQDILRSIFASAIHDVDHGVYPEIIRLGFQKDDPELVAILADFPPHPDPIPGDLWREVLESDSFDDIEEALVSIDALDSEDA